MKQDWKGRALPAWYNKHLKFAPLEIASYLAALEIGGGDSLADFGCGNGELLRHAAPLVAFAAGVDASPEQAALARENTRAFANVRIIEGQFLACELPETTFTKGSARKSLHHLADEEKPLFFRRIGSRFKAGALFQVEDAVLDFPKTELDVRWPEILREAEDFYGQKWPGMEKLFENTLKNEFPSDLATWKAALAAGGFKLTKHERRASFYGVLLARKE